MRGWSKLVGVVCVVGCAPLGSEEVLHLEGMTAHIDRAGIEVRARSAPSWRWSLAEVQGAVVPDVASVTSHADGDATVVELRRGPLIERYVDRGHAIEQQFDVLWPSGDGALILRGALDTDGVLHEHPGGWSWSGADRAITLGDVRAWDASGTPLPATMRVTQEGTEIALDPTALAAAVYPLHIDPEIGVDDLELARVGRSPALAYNATDDVTLAVFDKPGVDGGVRGVLLDGAGDILGGGSFPIVTELYSIRDPEVVWNAVRNEFLVAYVGGGSTGEMQVRAQRLDGAAALIGSPVVLSASDWGSSNAVNRPRIAYNPDDDEYLVVWYGRTLADNDEIYAQRVDGDLVELGTDDLKLTETGTPGDPQTVAIFPDVAYHSGRHEYRVVASRAATTGDLEVYTLAVPAAATSATAPVAITTTGVAGDHFAARLPELAWDPVRDRFLVAYEASAAERWKTEIFLQLLAADGSELTPDDQQLTSTPGNDLFDATTPEVVFATDSDRWLVAWSADEDTLDLVDGELEVFAQVLTPDGVAAEPRMRLSHYGIEAPGMDAWASGPVASYDPTRDVVSVGYEGHVNLGASVHVQRVVVSATRDGDGDGVPDYLDLCLGFDDGSDLDADGVPDGCDRCLGSDVWDADGDGVPDGCDICPGFVDAWDADGDGVPDGCDACTGDDVTGDRDGDGLCDDVDTCVGEDAHGDSDGDGVCELQLVVPPLTQGDSVGLTADGAPPGTVVQFYASTTPGSTCHPAGVCVDLAAPVPLGFAVADGMHRAVLYVDVPTGPPAGTIVDVQAAWVSSGVGTASQVETRMLF